MHSFYLLTALLFHLPAALTTSVHPRQTDCTETVTVSDLTWHNSTHNLDCAGAGPDPGNNTTCIGNTCGINICSTGLPTQPWGYGPPDTFQCSITGIGACSQSNPGSVPLRTIGSGYIRCGGSAPTLFFEGSSEGDGARMATVKIQTYKVCGEDETLTIVTGEKQFKLDCEHDQWNNATCTAANFDVQLSA